MAIPTPVNGMITDAVTQASVEVLGNSPSTAISAVYQSLAHSTGILYENAVSAQQQASALNAAITSQAVLQLFTVGSMSGAVAAAKLGQSDTPENLLNLLSALRATSGS